MKNGAKSKPMLKASDRVPTTGMIGGTSNREGNTSSKKTGATMAFNKGGKVRSSKTC